MEFKIFATHWKLKYFGDKTFEKNGGGILPCKKCGKPFHSYVHYGEVGYVYDTTCLSCK